MADRTHACPGSCGTQVPQHRFACPTDWYRLPAEYRCAITNTYRRDQRGHITAMAAAIEWYRANPREARRG